MSNNEEINKENYFEKYPFPVTIEKTNIILEQMKNCICKIQFKNCIGGTGFFCSIPTKDNNIKVLITNNNVINEEIIKNNKIIRVTLNDDKIHKKIRINEERKIYINKKYNITIIEINPKEDDINDFLEFDIDILELDEDFLELNENKIKNNQNLNNKYIYIIQYFKHESKQKASVSYGVLKLIEDFNLIHLCNTDVGSLGSPILNLMNHKVIGMHKQNSFIYNNYNGILLKNSINEYLNNINIINNYNNKKEEIIEYSFECLNKNNLKGEIYEGEKEIKIELLMKNNKDITWPKDITKLVFDYNSNFILKDIILLPQKYNEIKNYEIIINKLEEYPSGDYNIYLRFEVNGEQFGEKIEINFVIKEDDMIKVNEFREIYKYFNIVISDDKLLDLLKKNNFEYDKTFKEYKKMINKNKNKK